ncbi:putative PH domain protein [Trichinella spiralis]|uniref:putative PH domain protein n=1 Tax=Trichinella spiralis TaxID=6334 RepID=UPI0001EFD3C1|nr:putative PH domain protein [Trichinella spiralis]
MLHSADNSASLIRRANWIYRLEETNPDNLIKGWLVLYENGLLEFKDDLNQPTSCRQIFLGNANVKVLAGYACQELLVSNQKLENAFVIVDAEKNHFFKCDTSEELRLWVNDLRNVIQRKKAEVKIYAPYGQPPVYVYGTLYEVPHHNEYTNHMYGLSGSDRSGFAAVALISLTRVPVQMSILTYIGEAQRLLCFI